MPVRQSSGRPPGSSPLRGEHRDARDPTCGTNASADRPCPAPPDGTTRAPATLPGCPLDGGARQCTGYRRPVVPTSLRRTRRCLTYAKTRAQRIIVSASFWLGAPDWYEVPTSHDLMPGAEHLCLPLHPPLSDLREWRVNPRMLPFLQVLDVDRAWLRTAALNRDLARHDDRITYQKCIALGQGRK